MGYPEKKTVGELLDYLQDLLDQKVVQRDSPIFIEMYALSHEETFLKNHEEQLNYHVPDEIPDEAFSFRMGWWSGSPDPTQDGAAYVALSCYLTHDRLFYISQEKINPALDSK